jgi:propanol-preferring alcohol dehydrogenase
MIDTMHAMLLRKAGTPLVMAELPVPVPGPNEVLIKVNACAVCRTDLHIVDGDLKKPNLPLVPGHEIVGVVVKTGEQVDHIQVGQRVGVPWLGSTCGKCEFCVSEQENLCDQARFTGYDINGGYAQYTIADCHFVFPLPDSMTDEELAPLLCAGLIGYRSLRMAGDVNHLGVYGFGAAAHIISQVAIHEGRQIYAFTRPQDAQAQAFALELGASWAGDASQTPPVTLDAAIIYAPVGDLVPAALRVIKKAGTVVCAGIHMSNIPEFPYEILWGERCVRSVANLTRRDGEEFLQLVGQIPLKTTTQCYPLGEANTALKDLRCGHLQGAAVLKC